MDAKEESKQEELEEELEEQQPEESNENGTWEAILAALPEDAQAAYNLHVTGLKSALDKERKSAKTANKKVTEFEKLQREAEEAQLSELEKTRLALERAQTEARLATERLEQERTEAAIKLAATKLKFNDPADAVVLLDASQLEWDTAKSKFTNLEALLKSLVAAKPYLVVSDTKVGPGGMPPRNNRVPEDKNSKAPTPIITL